MQNVVHPGPVAKTRIDVVPCHGCEIEVELAPDIPLAEAVAQATANFDSAYLEFLNAPVSQLNYVIPALAPDDSHVAWYSDALSFDGPGHIDRLGMIVGKYNGASFLHGHGVWRQKAQGPAMGHILAQETFLARPVIAWGIGVTGARFDRAPDQETNFELFQAQGAGQYGDHAIVRLRPNQDFATALDAALASLGWGAARVRGLGSLIGAAFENGDRLNSLATEFLIEEAVLGPHGRAPEIVIVGVDGSQIRTGRLARGKNLVLITAELVLSRIAN